VRTTHFTLKNYRIDYGRGPASKQVELLLEESYGKTAGE
jgi:hypothetical protein